MDFGPGGIFFESFGCLGCLNDRAHRILSRGCSGGKGQELMSSPVRPLEFPTKSWPQIPWRADQHSISFEASFGVLNGGWIWGVDTWWMSMEMHGSGVRCLLERIR